MLSAQNPRRRKTRFKEFPFFFFCGVTVTVDGFMVLVILVAVVLEIEEEMVWEAKRRFQFCSFRNCQNNAASSRSSSSARGGRNNCSREWAEQPCSKWGSYYCSACNGCCFCWSVCNWGSNCDKYSLCWKVKRGSSSN